VIDKTFERAKQLLFPIKTLVALADIEDVPAGITSLHPWAGGIAAAVWLENPTALQITEVTRLLAGAQSPDPMVDYLRRLSPSARERILMEGVVAFFRLYPSAALAAGMPYIPL
jgi:hypothetical protein